MNIRQPEKLPILYFGYFSGVSFFLGTFSFCLGVFSLATPFLFVDFGLVSIGVVTYTGFGGGKSSSLLFVREYLMAFMERLKSSPIAMEAMIQTAGAKTSINLTITQEKYVPRTTHIARNSLPRVILCTKT